MDNSQQRKKKVAPGFLVGYKGHAILHSTILTVHTSGSILHPPGARG